MPEKKVNRKSRYTPRILRILESLAQGIDPYTGDVLSETSPFNQVETVRALYKAINALKWQMEQKLDPADLPKNAGKPWPKQELGELHEEFRQGKSIDELAEKHQRTRGAIEAQLLRLVLLDQQQITKGQD